MPTKVKIIKREDKNIIDLLATKRLIGKCDDREPLLLELSNDKVNWYIYGEVVPNKWGNYFYDLGSLPALYARISPPRDLDADLSLDVS